MQVKNRACIRKVSFKSLWASRRRNVITMIAIVLTTLLFTSLFTVTMSINASYESYQFRMGGGYCHGTFKDVTEEQAAAISEHKNVKAVGARTVVGIAAQGVFAKTSAEISYMDENCTKWSYAQPTTGRIPRSGKEVAMDTAALALLDIEPQLGTEVSLTYTVTDKDQIAYEKTDTFILCGYWEYDQIMPVHYINVTKDYAEQVEEEAVKSGLEPFRTDLNVMMGSSVDIEGQMMQVDRDLGYTWESFSDDNSVRIGVNWGYTSAQLASGMDAPTVLAIIACLMLIIFTGYLIIYNIFHISVSGDIRFYGLLKTIGVTPHQLRRMIRQQALFLCTIGIPIGLLAGYGVGAVLTPVVMARSSFGAVVSTVSTSPLIFAVSALFALITVLISAAHPGRIAARVSPVEATKYTEVMCTKKKSRRSRGAKVYRMAFANLGRNKRKTVLVVISLSLAVVLLNILVIFVGGCDVEKYLAQYTCADFVVSDTAYFRCDPSAGECISKDMIDRIEAHTSQRIGGCGYKLPGMRPQCWMSEASWRMAEGRYLSDEELENHLAWMPRRGDLVANDALLEGLDEALFGKLTVVAGELQPLFANDSHAIALSVDTDDYGKVMDLDGYPALGDTLTLTYIEESYFIDSRTGEKCDENTPEEYLEYYIAKSRDVDYTVCAYVVVPYPMSYRYSVSGGYHVVLPKKRMETDSGLTAERMMYLFDTTDAAAEAAAEDYLVELTNGEKTTLMYESKATQRAEFEGFRQMFVLIGGLLCVVVGLVGCLNFTNAVMTGILARRHEFAVLQSVGMTSRQLKMMLVCEGLCYALGAAVISLVLCAGMSPLVGRLLEGMFWFFRANFTLAAVFVSAPIFALLGWLVPSVMYAQMARHSVVERLRETE